MTARHVVICGGGAFEAAIALAGTALARKQLPVEPECFQTNERGVFAVGDINHYPGKKKLILCGSP